MVSSGIKQQGVKADDSLPSIVEVKNVEVIPKLPHLHYVVLN
jgi:hypothetical protein